MALQDPALGLGARPLRAAANHLEQMQRRDNAGESLSVEHRKTVHRMSPHEICCFTDGRLRRRDDEIFGHEIGYHAVPPNGPVGACEIARRTMPATRPRSSVTTQ